jgi:hypothetical protein
MLTESSDAISFPQFAPLSLPYRPPRTTPTPDVLRGKNRAKSLPRSRSWRGFEGTETALLTYKQLIVLESFRAT